MTHIATGLFVVVAVGRQILDSAYFGSSGKAREYASRRCVARHIHRNGEACPFQVAQVTGEGDLRFVRREEPSDLDGCVC